MSVCSTDIVFVFFFSSRRRHTRFDCDWSSDVCSSDLTPQRRPTSLSAAPCEGLTRFTSGRPADLGRRKLACRLPVLYGRRTTPPPLRARASRLLEPTLHRVHARVQRLVAGGVGGIEDAGIATRRVVRDPMVLHRGQAACQPGARYLATGELGGLPGEGPHNLSQRVTGHVESCARRWWRRRGRRRCSL